MNNAQQKNGKLDRKLLVTVFIAMLSWGLTAVYFPYIHSFGREIHQSSSFDLIMLKTFVLCIPGIFQFFIGIIFLASLFVPSRWQYISSRILFILCLICILLAFIFLLLAFLPLLVPMRAH